jgi:undecaprenyl diphosphate synthase
MVEFMDKMPNHIGLIMDGNRRWAKEKGLTTLRGHEAGAEALRKAALYAFKRGIKFITIFAFSTENWGRDNKEVSHLMDLLVRAINKHLQEFIEAGIKIVFVGSKAGLSQKVLETMGLAETSSAMNTKGTLAVCFNYSGQQEIVDAVRAIVSTGAKADSISNKTLVKHLYRPELPPVDVVVRTSGEMRLSNFLIWQTAYSELIFTSVLWPDFGEKDIDGVVEEYNKRQRRYGK